MKTQTYKVTTRNEVLTIEEYATFIYIKERDCQYPTEWLSDAIDSGKLVPIFKYHKAMRLKRLHPSREAAKAYVATLPNYFDVEVFRLKSGKYWVGSYLEWLNRY